MNARRLGARLMALLVATALVAPSAARASESAPVALANGDASTCRLDGDGAVHCWGSDAYGELGDGEPLETRYRASPVGGLAPTRGIAAGVHHACAVQTDGAVRCWGNGSSGQLGNGATDAQSPVPVPMDVPDAIQVGGGYHHTCVLLAAGTVRCAGLNNLMQLGIGSVSPPQPTPIAVPELDDVEQIAVGFSFACALRTDGSVWCWGDDRGGQTGVDPTATGICYVGVVEVPCTPRPVRVAGLPPVVQVTAGAVHACAVTAERDVWCWGENQSGQLYTPSALVRASWTPVKTPLADVATVDAGHRFTCALKNDGTTWCWGDNTYGQHGNGACCRTILLPALLPDKAKTLSAGGMHVCAVSVSDEVYCWGNNASRQLGYRTDPLRWSPIPRRHDDGA